MAAWTGTDSWRRVRPARLVAVRSRPCRRLLRQSIEALAAGDAAFFSHRLPVGKPGGSIRTSPNRRCSWTSRPPACRPHYDEVTLIGALGGGSLALFINGINLDEFPAYVAQFPLLVTFNGSQFDVPFLRAHFPEARLDQAHIDLRFALASLGYRGGLKAVERSSRPEPRPGDPGRGRF